MHGPAEESANGKADALALADEIATVAARMDAATHRLLTCIREFDESGEWDRQGSISCAMWLVLRLHLEPVTARERVRVARALGRLPHVDAALERGEISYSKVRVITRVATPENERCLLELARHSTNSQLGRVCRAAGAILESTYRPADSGKGIARDCAAVSEMYGGQMNGEPVRRCARRIPPALFHVLWNRDEGGVVLTHRPGHRAEASPGKNSRSLGYDLVQELVNELARHGIAVDNDTSDDRFGAAAVTTHAQTAAEPGAGPNL